MISTPAVAECRRYARDQCLHGLPAQAPSAADVGACVNAITAAGQCAAALGAETAPDACDPALATDGAAASVCDVIIRPERATPCAFLQPANDMAPEGS